MRWVTLVPSLAALAATLGALAPTRVAWAKDAHGIGALADADPAVRKAAAEGLGGSWDQGAPLAHVLAAVALEDDDAGVRAAARAAVEQLAVRACETWRVFLSEALTQPPKHAAYQEVASQIYSLGAMLTTFHMAAGLAEDAGDGERADALGILPLMLRESLPPDATVLAGLDFLLSDLGARGRPLARGMARAGLVLLATCRVRDGTDGAPGPAPETTSEAASWTALLDAEGADWLKESAAVVLSAVGRPGTDLLAKMANAGWLPALERLGRGAERAAPIVRATPRPGWEDQRVRTLFRLGERDGLLPPSPRPDADAAAVTDFCEVCAALAAANPDLARPALETLARIAAVADRNGRVARRAALVALGRLGPLPTATRRMLEGLARDARPADEVEQQGTMDFDGALARLALVRGSEASTEVRARLVKDLHVRDAERWRGEGHVFAGEMLRALPSLAGELDPVRKELEAALDEPRVEVPFKVAILRLLGRLSSADERTAALLIAVRAEREWMGGPPHELTEMTLAKHFVGRGAAALLAVEGSRAVADSLRLLGRRAAAGASDLVSMTTDADALLAWRATRALAAVRAK